MKSTAFESYLLVGAEFIHAVLDEVGECLHIAFALRQTKDIDEDLVLTLDNHIGSLRAFRDHANADVLSGWNQAPAVRSGEHKIVLIVLHTLELIRSLQDVLHGGKYTSCLLVYFNLCSIFWLYMLYCQSANCCKLLFIFYNHLLLHSLDF